MRPRPLDKTIAHKAINLSELSGNEKRVAGALLDHFNMQTAQCDPSHARIARLLGLSVRSVIRSLNSITAAGLFERIRHGGHSQRNLYVPVWKQFRKMDEEWSRRFRDKTKRTYIQNVSPEHCQKRHVPDDNAVTQTLTTNISKNSSPGPSHAKAVLPTRQASSQGRLAKPFVIKSVAHSEAAASAAERRWSGDLLAQFGNDLPTYSKLVESVDEQMQTDATAAEVKRRGAGIALIIDRALTSGCVSIEHHLRKE